MAITTEQIKTAIQKFLEARYEKKAEPLRKKREKARDHRVLAQIEVDLHQYREKYGVDTWLAKDALKCVRQLAFGTHLSKGVHPDSKGNNINFRIGEQALPEDLCGSQCVPEAQYELDANGNAAALPLATMLATEVAPGVALRDLLMANDPALKGAFGSDPVLSDRYQEMFRKALLAEATTPQSDERNKQLLWPNSAGAIAEDDYTCLIPLYPSALSHYVHRQIQDVKFAEEAKAARERYHQSRKPESAEKTRQALAAYRKEHGAPPVAVDLIGLAYVKLGGSNQQNVSQLNSRQGGRHYLLPSLPPEYQKPDGPPLRTSDKSFFNRALMYLCKEPKAQLEAVVKAKTGTYAIREEREQALDGFAAQVLITAQEARAAQMPGWTDDYRQLPAAEKYWLDPENAAFADPESIPADWRQQIAETFAAWLQAWLRKRFPQRAGDFDDVEYQEWLRWFSRALQAETRERRRTG